MKVLLIEPNIEGYVLMPSISLATLKAFINEKKSIRQKSWILFLIKKIGEPT